MPGSFFLVAVPGRGRSCAFPRPGAGRGRQLPAVGLARVERGGSCRLREATGPEGGSSLGGGSSRGTATTAAASATRRPPGRRAVASLAGVDTLLELVQIGHCPGGRDRYRVATGGAAAPLMRRQTAPLLHRLSAHTGLLSPLSPGTPQPGPSCALSGW